MKKIISILTATRAEYGLLKPLIKKLSQDKDLDIKIVATGAHLSPEFGMTYKEIESDGFIIDEKIEILLSSDTPAAITKSMGLALIGFASYFERIKPDMLIVLGDRYETLAVSIAAMNQRITIAHIHGGEITEGAIDDAIRHSITKLSYLHFTTTEVYRNRVIQLGEQPNRVFNVGALGIENILTESLLSRVELEKSLNISLQRPFAVVTFHPVTLETQTSEEQIRSLLDYCSDKIEMDFIFTKANADAEGRVINQLIDQYERSSVNIYAYISLGLKRYLSALKHCTLVMGNSSSGLLEAPSFNVPIVNIGDRQKGRLQASCILNCEPNKASISKAVEIALSDEFAKVVSKSINPYGDGKTSEKIIEVIKKHVLDDAVNLKKKFYDCEVK